MGHSIRGDREYRHEAGASEIMLRRAYKSYTVDKEERVVVGTLQQCGERPTIHGCLICVPLLNKRFSMHRAPAPERCSSFLPVPMLRTF